MSSFSVLFGLTYNSNNLIQLIKDNYYGSVKSVNVTYQYVTFTDICVQFTCQSVEFTL